MINTTHHILSNIYNHLLSFTISGTLLIISMLNTSHASLCPLSIWHPTSTVAQRYWSLWVLSRGSLPSVPHNCPGFQSLPLPSGLRWVGWVRGVVPYGQPKVTELTIMPLSLWLTDNFINCPFLKPSSNYHHLIMSSLFLWEPWVIQC